jgi:hypothetical protein
MEKESLAMHTAICSFDDRVQAERAMDRLVQSGFDRDDVHLQHRHVDGGAGRHSGTNRWDGMEREIAVDPSILSSFGHFFTSLFGADDIHGHAGAYTEAVERGGFVVVVDAPDDTQARRAQALLQELEAGNLNVVQRKDERRLRDIIGSRKGVMPLEQGAGTAPAGMPTATRDEVAAPGDSAAERDRAMASGLREQHTVGVRTGPDLTEPPGLRYADKDKPGS